MTEITGEMHSIAWALIVSDLRRSSRFYCEGLGFREGQTVQRGDEAARTLELESCRFQMQFISRPDMRLNLIRFEEPEAIGDGVRKSALTLGPLLMSFTCPDPVGASERLVKLGGTLIHKGVSASGRFDIATVADPDGFRVELNSAPFEQVLTMFGQ